MTGLKTKAAPVVAWARQWARLKPHQIIGEVSNPYVLRWFVIPKNRWIRVYVHRFLRSDEDRALHDHPWDFVSVILRGGYVEVSEDADRKMTVLCRTSVFDLRSPFWRRCVAYRTAVYRHRVQLPVEGGVEQPCWTLIITGRKVREWGFWCVERGLRGQQVGEWFVPWQFWGAAGCGET